MKRLINIVLLLSLSVLADNEISVSQAGDNANIDLEQLGSSNLIGGTEATSGSMTFLDLDGSSMTLDINQIGSSNIFRSDAIDGDNITGFFEFDGDSNVWDLLVNSTGLISSDYINLNIDVTGSSNVADIKIAEDADSSYLDQAPWQGIGLKSLLILLILTSASFKTTGEPQQGVRIGGVSELNGNASIVRDQNYPAELDFSIQQEDQAETANGRMAITFLDDSRVSLTENSKLKITKYIFDPNPDKSELGIRFTLGTARFVTGKFNKISKQNIQLETPTANIAIRGTSFTTPVDEYY